MKRLRLEHLVACLLAAWAVGLAVAAVRLDAWQRELGQTLMQLRADALFRANLSREQDKIQPEWYRHKAVAVITAMERMRHDAAWTLFMPGSWHVFDDLEERLANHLAQAFARTVVDTIHRELSARASQLSGVPQDRASGQLRGGGSCAAPAIHTEGTPALTPEELPEYAALTRHLAEAEALDAAVQALLRLQQPATARASDLQMLVRDTLQAELPAKASRSLAMFHALAERDGRATATLVTGLQGALRCSVGKGTAALHRRLLAGNDLLSLEDAVSAAGAGLFAPARPGTPAPTTDVTLVRYQTLAGLLSRQEQLLARGGHAWMRQAQLDWGPGYQGLLERIGRISLLGPQAAAQVQADAHGAFQQFRSRFDAAFGHGRSGIVWQPAQGRFAFAPERRAMHDGLAALLREPLLAYGAGTPQQAPLAQTAAWPGPSAAAPIFEDAQELLGTRRRLLREALPLFPAAARPSVVRFVDARIAQVAFERLAATMDAAPPNTAAAAAAGLATVTAAPPDAFELAARRERLVEMQAVLDELGAPALAQRLRETAGREQRLRMTQAEATVQALPLFDARPIDFGWWQGEPGPLARAFGVADGEALRRFVPDQASRLEALGRQAEQVLASSDPVQGTDSAAQRWAPLLAELRRYRSLQPDSSLAALEAYVATVGPDLRRDNCMERLATQPPPPRADAIGRRHAQLHQGLVARCLQLRQSSELRPAALRP